MNSCAVSHFLAILNNAAMNILEPVLRHICTHFFLTVYLGVELLGHKEYTRSTLAYTAKQFSKAVQLVYAPFSSL